MKRTLLLLIVLAFGISLVHGQTRIDEAKAKFIYNFTNFFEWPQGERQGDFVIGVLGSQDLYYELNDFTDGKKVILQQIAVKRFKSAGEVSNCHVVYVGEDHTEEIPTVKSNSGKNTLVISDSNSGLGIKKGAALNFLLRDNRLKYEFAASNAMNQGLKFSSRIRDMAARNY